MSNPDNNEQEELWNGPFGEGFIRSEEYLHKVIEPFFSIAKEKVNAKSGDYILDVGCGCGSTSISFAESGANVRGVDISNKMILHAKEKSKNTSNLIFDTIDATSKEFKKEYNQIFSQFGVMFFSDPYAAFSNLRKGLVEFGKITFLCWQSLSENEWINCTNDALEAFMPEGVEPPDPKSPGGFAFADKEYVYDILNKSNFDNIEFQSLNAKFNMGNSIDELMNLHLNIGPLSMLLSNLDEVEGKKATNAVRKSLESKMEETRLQLSAAAWLVEADIRP